MTEAVNVILFLLVEIIFIIHDNINIYEKNFHIFSSLTTRIDLPYFNSYFPAESVIISLFPMTNKNKKKKIP